ncbi:hypothetical protein KIN20_030324 [Parelaphostrongylus tenuis]|uniref:Uncharacterized protein n=1 Tax=Parelaphostrongylus tenuis TaxID=148309 RepID=A0AAD5R3W6_PARTN|nr:hypothetical protein KIN20_030324 [Parelaphostrongylus tenuis]
MSRLSPYAIMVSLLTAISTVLGCGVMPAGQESTRTFNVTGFTLPLPMVYSSTGGIQYPGIAANKAGAMRFVKRLVRQTVFDVLKRQARNALLPDPVISAILGQLRTQINYKPLSCQLIITPEGMLMKQNKAYCIIVDNTVTGICTGVKRAAIGKMCMKTDMDVKITAVPGEHLTISGTLSTTNIIMSNWSKAIWENIVNRAIRMLASGPFGSHFFSATGTVSGN